MNKIARQLVLKKITNNLGKVEVTEDEIICYVKKHKCKRDSYTLDIPCHGQRKKYHDLVKKYDLDKPIVYVIEDMVVKYKKVFIFGYDDADIIIRNCKFLYDIYGRINGKCLFESNYVRTLYSFVFSAKELIVKEMYLINHFPASNSKYDISLEGDEKLQIEDSTIGKMNQKTNVHLYSQGETKLINSNVQSDDLSINSRIINSDNKSKMKSKRLTMINAEEYNNLNITSDELNIDGNKVKTDKQGLILSSIKDEKQLKRCKLINILNKIKEDCIKKKQELLSTYEEKINKEEICKVLTK